MDEGIADPAVALAAWPNLTAALLAEHVPNDDGRCRACRTGGTGVPYARWPCALRLLAERARKIAQEDAQ